MDLIVKKFAVRYGGRDYGPGQLGGEIIADVPDSLAKSLVAGSNGTIAELPRREAGAEKAGAEKARAGKKAAADGLGSIDPGSLVEK
jgi:hypothetical protein